MKGSIIVLFLLANLSLSAQFDPNWGFINASQADSTKKALTNEKNDTLLMAGYRSLGFFYQEIQLDSAAYFHEKQLELARKLKLKMWIADANTQLASTYALSTADINKTYNLINEAITLSSDPDNENSNWHPWIFSNARNLREARIAILAMAYNGIASIYSDSKERVKEQTTHREIIELGKSINNGKLLALGYMRLASTYENDSTAICARKSIYYANQSGYKKYLGTTYGILATSFYHKKQYDSLRYYLHTAIEVSREQDNRRSLAFAYWGLSVICGEQNQQDSAMYYVKQAEEAVRSTRIGDNAPIYKQLAEVYSLLNKPDSAFKYQRLFSSFIDSTKSAKIEQLTEYQQTAFNEQLRLKKINDDRTAWQNRMKLYGALGVLLAVIIVASLLYRNNKKQKRTNALLEKTLADLKSTQGQLVHAEKMASLGELTAGIAHEIQNPLNFVNNFSEVSLELVSEVKSERLKVESERDKELEEDLLGDIAANLEKIHHHGKRADAIVKGMLQHSRTSTGQKELTDINALCDEYLRLSYHGLRAKDKDFNAKLETNFDSHLPKINIVPQDMGRVLMNMITNALYAVNERRRQTMDDGPQLEKKKQFSDHSSQMTVDNTVNSELSSVNSYIPIVSITTSPLTPGEGSGVRPTTGVSNFVVITIADNGIGIPENIKQKIFQPFFTTKPTGEGTGLGLSLAYDVIKAHGGSIDILSKEGEGTSFIITLPS